METMTDEYLDEFSKKRIIETAEDFIKTASSPRSAMEAVVGLLHASVPYYDWVGIYLMGANDVLRLGPYRGEPSPHTEISLDKGICGAAAREKKTIIVDDVRSEPGYLACSPQTRSEIVVPIIRDNRVMGEIDIDSDRPAVFTGSDTEILEAIAARLAELLASNAPGIGN
jgi:putative methionine-R-sulfoxide reductase with GAF domain